MSYKTKATVAVTLLASSVYLSGCGLFGGDKMDKIDPPQKVTSLSKSDSLKDVEKKTVNEENAVMTELYLIDKNGYVVSQTLALPDKTEVATQALEYLVQDGPIQNMIPNGFRAVLPANTEMSVNIEKDGTAVVDFSNEFKKYAEEDEEKILESITWTLTQFDTVKKVKLMVNGEALKAMPVNGTPINEDGLTRANGINIDLSDVIDVTNTHPLTLYYLAENGENSYYVPVTKRVPNIDSNDASATIKQIVDELVKGPNLNSPLVSAFLPEVALLDEPTIQDGKVTLNFNDSILGSFESENKMITDNVLKPLVYSLTEKNEITSVAVEVDGSTKLVDENGEPLTEPVIRPEKVNTGSF